MSIINFLPKTATLAPTLTSYDFLKTAAIILMIIDHVGYYFYPENMWFRAVGRMSAPIWFFLIGYAQSRDVGLRMWAACAVLILSNWIFGAAMLPINIIGTMIVFRLILDHIMGRIVTNPNVLYPFVALLFVLEFPSAIILEYGVAAFLMVMAGYLARNRESLSYSNEQFLTFCFVAIAVHALYQVKIFFAAFGTAQEILAGVGMMAVMVLLTAFRPYRYEDLTQKLPKVASGFFRLCGRWSLEIYVFHLILFKIIAGMIGTTPTNFFNFHML